MRVLICDDNRDTADLLEALVAIENYETCICYDGSSCIQKVRQWRPEAVLLDIGLPGMTGYEIAQSIREMDFGKDVLLVAITGYGGTDHKTMATTVGFDVHLTKPADPNQLFQLLGRAGARRQARCSPPNGDLGYAGTKSL
jgi:CheY-like chemotaxis protein